MSTQTANPALLKTSTVIKTRHQTMVITPEIAKQWWENNKQLLEKEIQDTGEAKNNRKIREGRVRDYANRILHDRWQLNGEPIKFGVSGKLLDGQHRLLAIIKTNRAIVSDVVWGIPDDAFKTLDSGSPRTISDAFGIANERNQYLLAAVVKYQWMLEEGTLENAGAGKRLGAEEAFEVLERNPDLRQACSRTRIRMGIMSPSVQAFLRYNFSKRDPELTEFFFEKLDSGVDLHDGSPILVLRNKLMNQKKSGTRLNSIWAIAYSIKAWNALRSHKAIRMVGWRERSHLEPLPDIK